jgi:DNA mismatch endonuclease (patch repair protein)
MARVRRRIPAASSPAVRATMRANRAKDTTPELVVRSLLREAGFTGYRLHWRTPAGRVDIAFVGRKIAIEVYGCFWHRCPRCAKALPKRNRAFWRAKFRANQLRDRRMRARLKESGWRVSVIWECQTERDGFGLPARLVTMLGHRRVTS